MEGVTLTPATRVEFYPLHIGEPDHGQQVVGRAETGTFIALPPEGVALIQWLQEGRSVGEAQSLFASQFGQPADLSEFLEGLVDCGFVRRIGDWSPQLVPVVRTGWQLLGGIRTERLQWLLSRPMKALYVGVWAVVPVLLVLRPDLLPSAADAWVHPRMMINALLLAVVTWVCIFLHELAHLLAVRANGCSGYLAISHRLHFLVAHVDMSSVRTLPRSRRYGPYLAGMTWDLAVLSVCLILQMSGVARVIPGLVAYVVTLSLLLQFAFFMRTDVYYLFANWLDLGNLLQDTQRWLLRRLPPNSIPERELQIVRGYACFYVAGVAVVVGQFVVFHLPLLVRFATESVRALTRPDTFWDGALFLGLTAANFGALLYVWWRERRR